VSSRSAGVDFLFEPVNVITQSSAVLHMQAGQEYANGNVEVAIELLRRAMTEHGYIRAGDGVGAAISANLAGLATRVYHHCLGVPQRVGICIEPWKLLHDARNAVEVSLRAQPASSRLPSLERC
jgi:hypothetical protein